MSEIKEAKITNRTKLTLARAKRAAPIMFYVADVVCTNCLEHNILTIPKGVTVVEHASKKLCEYCGCTVMEDLIGEVKS